MKRLSHLPLVYIDETGIDTFLHREYAYAPKGEKVYGSISGRKYKRVGIVAGQMNQQILAPIEYNGTMDSLFFEHWFTHLLLPSLPSEAVIIMDNASFHRKKQLFSYVTNTSHTLLFLPPYSPELNPIEHFWAWLKRHLKKILPAHLTFHDALCSAFKVC